MKAVFQFLKREWIGVTLAIWFILLIPMGVWMKDELRLLDFAIVGSIYLICEILWNISFTMVLWYSGAIRGFFNFLKKLFNFNKSLESLEPNTKAAWAWFGVNRFVAIAQPSVAFVVAFFILGIPFRVAWGPYLYMCADLTHTIFVILWFTKKMRQSWIRRATIEDLPRLVEIDRIAFPDEAQQADASNFRQRITTSSRTCLVLDTKDHGIVGAIYGRPIRAESYLTAETPPSWEMMANGGDFTPPERSDAIYVVGIAAIPEAQEASGRLEAALAKVAVSMRIKFLWAGSRIPGYHKHANMTPDNYVLWKHKDGLPKDPTLRLLVKGSKVGPWYMLRPVRALENSFPDPDSLNFAALVEAKNPFFGFPFPKLWGWVMEQAMLHL